MNEISVLSTLIKSRRMINLPPFVHLPDPRGIPTSSIPRTNMGDNNEPQLGNFLPSLRDLFDENGLPLPEHAGTLPVHCGICTEELAFFRPEGDGRESLAVLPCGHYLGHKCLREWMKQRARSDLKACCPFCRWEPSQCCRHALFGELYPSFAGRRLSILVILAKLIPRLSREQTHRCNACRRRIQMVNPRGVELGPTIQIHPAFSRHTIQRIRNRSGAISEGIEQQHLHHYGRHENASEGRGHRHRHPPRDDGRRGAVSVV
ncbi:hypothetical protein F5Y16DRAFT_358006 [Xylariaceae sp. FL0255]|nr:hypothetical protein F5Y16DRAFT_358006 [Xylariaceae sp. FL0255]